MTFARCRKLETLLLALVLLAPIGASAAPVTYAFDSGSITYRVTAGTQELAVATVAMTGTFATFDDMSITLDDFSFDTGASGVISLSPTYADIASVLLHTSTIAPVAGYSTLFGSDLGGGQYSVTAGPIDITGSLTATTTGGSSSTQPFSLGGNSILSATITLAGARSLEITGLTLASVPAFGGEVNDLIIKADIIFNGTNPIPEPAAAVLMLAGLLVVRGAIRR